MSSNKLTMKLNEVVELVRLMDKCESNSLQQYDVETYEPIPAEEREMWTNKAEDCRQMLLDILNV